jgi:hypothetical protein
MKNREDIGNAIGAIYGAAAGTQLTSLLKEHITIAVDLIKAAKAGDKAAQQNWDADVRAFDAVHDHILKMSDALTDGIVKQYPQKCPA